MKKLVILLLAGLMLFLFSSDSSAGFLDDLLKQVEKSLPKGIGGPQSGSSGSAIVQSDSTDYKSASIINLLCLASPPEGLRSDPAPQPKLVANDFGMSVENTQSILQDKSGSAKALPWATTLNFYENAFNETDVKGLFKAFVLKPAIRIDIASQIRQIAYLRSIQRSEQREISDAQFAYSLILSHYNKFHSKQKLAQDLLDAAGSTTQVGALYIEGKRYYLGWGVRRDIDKAANLIASAQSPRGENDEEEQNNDEVRWDKAQELWHQIAVDPNYSRSGLYRSLQVQADKIKSSIERELKKNSGSALRQKVDRLNGLRIKSLKKLSKAFGFAREFAEKTEKWNDLLNQANPDQQVIEKKVAITEELTQFAADQIRKSDKELDAKGRAFLKEASDLNRFIIAQLGATVASVFLAAGNSSSILSDWAALAPAMHKGIRATCSLQNAVVDYTDKRSIQLPKDSIITEEESDKIPDGD